ncbi:hypothetical protein RGQ15_02905 [Paracoccus sp. MBLB3053]|uniref:DUF2746 domain-containing protein n=1 Tax=Paracoccus aurantius TaxID=3073814 RepID=A0ABU2HNC0_9RHOB|nr:hypothetical protein [Paracoccus sp. MBLB3053]MDS9466526.1 hypothetical protein [Paracoccus sp. MBLB3053]
MNRNEFIIATAVILFAAFLLGWFARSLIHRLGRVTRAEIGELESMAQELHRAEEERDKAVELLETREVEWTSRLGAADTEIRQSKAQLLECRTEIEELRDFIDSKLGRKN